eukprot:TRINITY_DN353_c0_g1_i1.p2 TRINITY_DN353_c0_g1~~TRINITY_DN353_c0_g1_i1.p2  ORF type:complete len:164 (-),score=49.79 TRINITY_DN353_c0_g1_i1:155-613(-)
MNKAKAPPKNNQVRIGGKGTARRKRKVQPKRARGDTKALQANLKRLQVNVIPGVDEVNFFMEDGTVQHFQQPKVQANVNSNTYVISGPSERKQMQELLPGIIDQLGHSGIQDLKKFAESLKSDAPAGGDDDIPMLDDDNDDVPELVENFDDA